MIFFSGMMSVDISCRIFTFVGQINPNKSLTKKVYRLVDDNNLINIQNYLNGIDWNLMQNMNTDQSYDHSWFQLFDCMN